MFKKLLIILTAILIKGIITFPTATHVEGVKIQQEKGIGCTRMKYYAPCHDLLEHPPEEEPLCRYELLNP